MRFWYLYIALSRVMGRHLFCCPHLEIDCVNTKQGDSDCEVIICFGISRSYGY